MKRFLKISSLSIMFIAVMSIYSIVNAASATLSVSTTSTTVGKKVTVTVTTKAATTNLEVSGAVSGSIQNINMDGENETKTKTYTFTPSKAGSYKISLSGDITDANGTTSDVSTSKTITVKEASDTTNTTTTKKSNNANLSTLGVTPKEYDFSGFTANKTNYEVTIPSNVDSLKVSYKTADSKAKATVKGNTNLEVGTNNITVEVKAEDGTTKTYTIKVTKLATEDNKPGNLIDDNKNELALKSLSIDGLDLSPEFSSNVFAYTTTINMDEDDLSEVKVNAEANDNKATVEITGNTDLKEGENVINIIVKSADSSEQKTYQITVNKISKNSEIVADTNNKGIRKEHIIIAFGIIFIIIVILLWIRYLKKSKETLEDEDYDEDEKLYNYEDEEEESNYQSVERDNLVEELFGNRKKENNLNQETLDDIKKENDRIFNKDNKEETIEDLEKRKKGRHF